MVAPALKYESNWTEKYILVNHLSRPFIWESLRNFIFSRPIDDSWKLWRTALKAWKQDVLLIAPLPNHWFGNSIFPCYLSIVVNSFSFSYDFQLKVEIIRMTASVWYDCAKCRIRKITFTRWSKFATTDFVDWVAFMPCFQRGKAKH